MFGMNKGDDFWFALFCLMAAIGAIVTGIGILYVIDHISIVWVP